MIIKSELSLGLKRYTLTEILFQSKRKQKMSQISEIAQTEADRMTSMFSCGGMKCCRACSLAKYI